MNSVYLDLLKQIYNEAVATATANALCELVASYREITNSSSYRLSEKDAVLITYGDSIQRSGQMPLTALGQFYKEHLKELINTVHILPFHPFTSDDGFSVIDYYQINESLGNWSDIENLGVDARLMFDMVVNHISVSSEWFQGYLAGDSRYADWFINVDPGEDLSQVTRPRSLPLLSEFTASDGTTRHIWTTFSKDQADLNFRNPNVFIALIKVLMFFIAEGARLIRLDAVAFLWKQLGTTCINLPETHIIIKLMRCIIEDVCPEVLIITETNVPHLENISYFGNGDDEAHLVYNFALPPLVAYSLITGNAEQLQHWAQDLKLPSDKTCFFNFTASHDGVGVRPVENILTTEELDTLIVATKASGGLVSYKSNPDGSQSPYELNCTYIDLLSAPTDSNTLRARRLVASQAIAMAMPGIPAIYIHTLMAVRNDLDAVKQLKHNRAINRPKLDVTAIEKDLEDETSLRSLVFAQMSKLLMCRQTEQAFSPFGSFNFDPVNFTLHDKRVFSVMREDPTHNHRLLCLTNVSSEVVTVDSGLGELTARDIISGDDYLLHQIILSSYETLWLNISR